MDVDKNSGSDNDGDSSDEEEDEYDEEWLELRQTSIAAASLPFHQLELNQKVNLLKWLCDEVMESDVVRDQMDDLHDMDKTLRREREAMKKKIRKVSKEQIWAYRAETISKIAPGSEISTRSADQLPKATSSTTTNGVPLTKVAVTPKAKVVVSNEDKRYAWSKANYEGRKYIGYNFKKEIEGYGFQPGLVIKFIASEKIGREKEDSKFVIRYNDGTIVENVSPLELVKCGVPLKLGTFGFTTDEIYNFMIGINGDTPRGRGRPRTRTL